MTLAEQQRLQREHDEAERLLVQQRALICDLEAMRQPSPDATSPGAVSADAPCGTNPGAGDPTARRTQPDLPEELVHHYRELLRAYVIMGSGNLAGELGRLAELLATAGVTARQTMSLHLHAVEELVHGLGARSTRHVMTRADLLVLEIMIHLAERYRERYQERIHPPVQRLLPGFEPPWRMAG